MENFLGFLILNFYALIIIGATTIIFFSKQRQRMIEDETYAKFLLTNIFISLSGLFLGAAVIPAFKFPNISIIFFNKLYLITLICWILILTFYTFFVTLSNKDKIISWRKTFRIIAGLSIFLVLVLPIKMELINNTTISSGPAITYTYLIFGLGFITQLICILSDYKNFNNKKYIPFYLLILIGSLVLVAQMLNPGLNYLINPGLILIAFIMYFTIENPDVKYIKELNLAKDTAEKANLAKTEFLSSMSHEIRTPLNAIVGFSECMLNDKKLNAETKGFAKDIVDASNNLLEIVNGILDISKIEANKMEIIAKEYNPREVFNSLSKLVIPRISEKEIEFKMVVSPDLPGVLKGDVGKLKQIVLNILTNAAKYTEKGEIIFNINCINRTDTNTCLLYISVKDTGRGIKKENIDKLFTKFERLDEERNTTTEGTGLGLAITKSLAEMMGGRINVFSKYGEGSTFRIYLEQELISMEIPDDHSEEIKIDYDLYKGKRILIVDDSKINIKVAAQILKPYNFSLVTAESGFEALELAKTQTFDLIFLDIMMPKMNGVETLKRLNEINGFNVPVVALTADAIEASDEKYLNQGFNAYLSKPIDRYELNRILNKYLGGKKDGKY